MALNLHEVALLSLSKRRIVWREVSKGLHKECRPVAEAVQINRLCTVLRSLRFYNGKSQRLFRAVLKETPFSSFSVAVKLLNSFVNKHDCENKENFTSDEIQMQKTAGIWPGISIIGGVHDESSCELC